MTTPLFFNKFTAHAKQALKDASILARDLRHDAVDPEHILSALAKQKGSIGTEILIKSGLTADGVKDCIVQHRSATPATLARPAKPPSLSHATKRCIEKAVLIASQFQHKYIGTEHLLSGILQLDDPGINDILQTYHVTAADLQQHLSVILKNTSKLPDLTNLLEQAREGGEDELVAQGQGKPGARGSAVEFFCTDLTDERLQESIDPVIGREAEIDRLINILARRTKNNPVLIGDPGVGKTAIVEGLAKRMLQRKVPSVLHGKKIYSLDLSLVVAGTVYRGEFEGRIKQIIDEIRANPNAMLFIDELHTIIGAGGASGSLDAANILKPALAKGQLRCIGATTLDEYHKHIESDAALERRFQPIVVGEPTPEETTKVLHGIKENYERYHHVGITDEAIRAAVDLSIRYLQDKCLPDKAIDLIDEAASRMKIAKSAAATVDRMKELEQRVSDLRQQKQDAVNHEAFDDALDLKSQESQAQVELAAFRAQQAEQANKIVGKITERDIASVVSRATGIPVGDILAQEQRRLLRLEAKLKKHIVGQDDVLHVIASSIRRSRTGLSSPSRPMGSFIFLGPSGVGKTETAKVLAKTVFGSEASLIRIDMSEFSESFQASKLIGAPAGYVGYKEGGKLTESVKRKPYSVVLFDEIEKAHPDIFNLLLQILDEGHLTDAVGKTINFKNTIIILTSNIGLAELNRQAAIGFEQTRHGKRADESFDRLSEKVLGQLRERFRPEFLNRIDHTLVFRPLRQEQYRRIVIIKLDEISALLRANRGISVRFDDSVSAWIAKKGFKPEQGARGLHHLIREDVEDPLATYLLEHDTPKGARLVLTAAKNRITIRNG